MNLQSSLLLLAMGVAAMVSPTCSALDIGGFSAMEVGDTETQLLTKVLADDALYAETLSTRACFAEIESLGSQVVSGTKYKFTVQGCITSTAASGGGKCAGESANCKAEPLVIMVFDQPWTETQQVLSIDKASGATADDKNEDAAANSTSSAGSADEEAPVMVTTTDGSASDKPETATTEAPAAHATSAPSSAVPSPAPTSGATQLSLATAMASMAALALANAM